MQETALYKFQVRNANQEAATFQTIVQNPRTSGPQDLLAAIQNTSLVELSQGAPEPVAALSASLVRHFFPLAHRTGLYNRQLSLWESLSKASLIEVVQLSQGILQSRPVPVYDLKIIDQRNRPIVLARLIMQTEGPSPKPFEAYFHSLLQKAQKTQGLAGLFFACPQPFPETIVSKTLKLIGGLDPVRRFESRLPEPLSIPINLLEFNADTVKSSGFRLLHPELNAGKKSKEPVMLGNNLSVTD